MENKSTTKEFLQLCHEQVVGPALENGLDEECYYRYLSEMYRAMTCDSGVRRKYHKMLAEAEKNMFAKFNSECDKTRKRCYWAIFKRQFNFMIELGSFACASIKDDATMALARGITSFIRIQLHEQKVYLDAIEDYVMSKRGMDAEDARKHFEAALDRCESAEVFLQGTIEHLNEIHY